MFLSCNLCTFAHFFMLNFIWVLCFLSLFLNSNIYYINDHLDKRTWTYIFGACCATTVFIPSFHNYRIWSFLGLGMTTYTAWYMAIAALVHGQVISPATPATATAVVLPSFILLLMGFFFFFLGWNFRLRVCSILDQRNWFCTSPALLTFFTLLEAML